MSTTHLSKVKTFTLWVGLFVVGFTFLFLFSTPTSPPTTSRAPVVNAPPPTSAPVWNNQAGDAIPVGVWSEWVEVKLGCTLDFYLDENNKAEWRSHNGVISEMKMGEHLTHIQAVRFMVMLPNTASYPYIEKCG